MTPPADPTRDGYVFTGWSGSYANITANTTLVAQYAPVASEICTVVFVDWNGNELKRQSVNKGESATAPETPERTGYRFVKWDKSFDNVTENVTVTAVYIKQYTVVFKDKDGDVLKTEIVDEGASATPPAAPEVEGYTFTGWEGNYSAVAQDEIVDAKYVENAPVIFTVKFVDWNEDVLKTETVRKGSGATAPADPTRDGYVFKGWDKAFDNVTGDMTVTAVYEEIISEDYNIKFLLTQNGPAKAGETLVLTLDVTSKSTAEVNGVVIDELQYDNSKLEFLGFGDDYGDLVTRSLSGVYGIDNSDGSVSLGYINPIVANGKICTLKFKVKDSVAVGTELTISMSAIASKSSKVISGIIAPSCTVNIQ